MRATVAHDSYERLVEVPCAPTEHHRSIGRAGLSPIGPTIEDPSTVGIDTSIVSDAAGRDEAVAEFGRFYLERREQETAAAAADARKRQKLQDEFTPRLGMTLVGVEGALNREVTVRAHYAFDAEPGYESVITVTPHSRQIAGTPDLALCTKSGRTVPASCLGKCEVTGGEVLRHLLTKSEVSGRKALPEMTVSCALSGKRVLKDEAEPSSVTGRLVASALMHTSALSGETGRAGAFRSLHLHEGRAAQERACYQRNLRPGLSQRRADEVGGFRKTRVIARNSSPVTRPGNPSPSPKPNNAR